MHEFARDHREMVGLVMGSTDQQADETEAANMLHYLGIGSGHRENNAARERRGRGAPAVEAIDLPGVRWDHPLNGGKGAIAARDGDLEAWLALAHDRPGLDDILLTMLMPCCLHRKSRTRIDR
jgi:hypothetical protein